MEIILSEPCLSLIGMLDHSLGYAIQKRGKRFFSQRSKHSVPPDGHWRFILLCAEAAQIGLHISDIRVSGYELKAALTEAGFFAASLRVDVDYEYNAAEVLNFKNERSL